MIICFKFIIAFIKLSVPFSVLTDFFDFSNSSKALALSSSVIFREYISSSSDLKSLDFGFGIIDIWSVGLSIGLEKKGRT